MLNLLNYTLWMDQGQIFLTLLKVILVQRVKIIVYSPERYFSSREIQQPSQGHKVGLDR